MPLVEVTFNFRNGVLLLVDRAVWTLWRLLCFVLAEIPGDGGVGAECLIWFALQSRLRVMWGEFDREIVCTKLG